MTKLEHVIAHIFNTEEYSSLDTKELEEKTLLILEPLKDYESSEAIFKFINAYVGDENAIEKSMDILISLAKTNYLQYLCEVFENIKNNIIQLKTEYKNK